MTQTTVYQPPLASIADLESLHFAWTSSYTLSKGVVTFKPYAAQHPIDAPVGVFETSVTRKIKLRCEDSNDRYILNRPMNHKQQSIPQDRVAIREKMKEVFQESYRNIQGSRYPHRRLSTPVKNRLNEKYDSYYAAISAPRTELRTVEGVGEKRCERLKSGKGYSPKYNPEWCWLSRCPECGEEWWSPQRSPSSDEEAEKPSVETLQEKVYCPVCTHDSIPEGYLTGPYKFTEETIDRYRGVTGKDKPQTEASLADY